MRQTNLTSHPYYILIYVHTHKHIRRPAARMKYFFAVALLAWLGLGTALPSAVNSVEESLIAEADGTALEEVGYWIPEDNVIEEGAVTITGCIPEATTFFDKYLSNIVAEVPKRIKSIQLTCSKCSSLVIDGEFKGSVTMCKSGKGIWSNLSVRERERESSCVCLCLWLCVRVRVYGSSCVAG